MIKKIMIDIWQNYVKKQISDESHSIIFFVYY